MIKKIEALFDKSIKNARDFLSTCTVSEKISAFYIHVIVVSGNCIRVCKADYKEIRIEDVILNRMWSYPTDDFLKLFLQHDDLMQYTGYTFSFFYLPVSKPFNVEYRNGIRYILSFVKDKDGKSVDTRKFDLNAYDGRIKKGGIILHDCNRSPAERKKIALMTNYKEGYNFIMNDLIGEHNENISCRERKDCEGFILKSGKSDYQILQNETYPDRTKMNRLPMEFVMHDFSRFLSSFPSWTDFIAGNDYSTNVSLLFNEYVSKYIDRSGYEFYNIKSSDLEAPEFGYYGGTGFEFIPVDRTRKICRQSKLYENIYKILLNGLKRRKKFSSKGMTIMTENDISAWNRCVSLIMKNF